MAENKERGEILDITNESEIDEDNDEEVTAAEVLKRLEQVNV